MTCAPFDAVISPQFAPVTPAFQANVQSSGRDARSAAASNDTSDAPRNSSSFSHVLKSYSNDGETPDRNSAKTAKPDRDPEDKAPEDGPASEVAVPVPVQQPLTLLGGLLGLLRQSQQSTGDTQENSASESADPKTTAGETDSAKPSNQSTTVPASSMAALTALMPAAAMPKVSPKTAESKPLTEHHLSSTLAMPATVPAHFEQFVNRAATDAEANLEPAKGSNSDPASSAVIEPTENSPAATNGVTAATTSAPVAFSMLISPDNQNATNGAHPAMPAAPSESASAAPSSDVQRFSSSLAANTGIQAPITPAAQQRTGDEAPGTLATAFASTERPHTSEDHATVLEPARAANPAELNTNADIPSRPELRNMRVQLEGDANQRVDVRLTDQSGSLRVSVRSADVNLTQTLQDHMPELTSRLDQQHFRTEVWVPPRSAGSATSESGASNTRSFHSNGGNTSGQDQSGRRQNGRQQNQPDWPGEDVPGQAGKQETNQTWLQ